MRLTNLASIRPGSLAAWWLAARPATLPLAFAPVLAGSALAVKAGCFSILPGIAALACSGLLQIVANLANDLFDFKKGADTTARLGPPRAAQLGLLSTKELALAVCALVFVLLLLGSYLVAHGGIWILAIGVFAIVSAVAYTAGPYPLAYHALGDVFVWIFFGYVATCGTVYLHCQVVPNSAWLIASSLGALANAVLVVNHIRDIDADRAANKRTLVVRFGRNFGISQYIFLLSFAMLVPILLFVLQWASWPVLLTLLLFPWCLGLTKKIRTESGVLLNAVLASTAKLAVVYSLLISQGILW